MAGKQKRNGLSRSNLIQTLIQMEGATIEQAERVADYIFDRGLQKQTTKTTKTNNQEHHVYCIPEEVFQQSLGHYEHNQFANLLHRHFGAVVANDLLKRFHIGTSSRWPGACIFWYIDEQDRKRGGQIKLFDDSFHTVKYIDRLDVKRSKTTWVHSSYARYCRQREKPYPAWLSVYINHTCNVQKSPCLFGLPQLKAAPQDQPIAIVEAPKTAVLCTLYFPGFIWLAVGSLSYLNSDRLLSIRERNVMLFPDLSKEGSAFFKWCRTSEDLQRQGFKINISNYLEQRATNKQKAAGFDLADYLLNNCNNNHNYSQNLGI